MSSSPKTYREHKGSKGNKETTRLVTNDGIMWDHHWVESSLRCGTLPLHTAGEKTRCPPACCWAAHLDLVTAKENGPSGLNIGIASEVSMSMSQTCFEGNLQECHSLRLKTRVSCRCSRYNAGCVEVEISGTNKLLPMKDEKKAPPDLFSDERDSVRRKLRQRYT